jgi:hypothetical protein
MVLKVIETEALAEAALPLDALRAQMRLPEGYDALPGQTGRLGQRLRAAIVGLERRLRLLFLAREVVLGGPGGATRMRLPVGPGAALLSVEQGAGDSRNPIEGGRIEEDGEGADLVLPVVPLGRVRVVIRAGFGAWDAVPAPLAQAVLLEAEGLETGMRQAVAIEALIAPWRRRSLGVRA